MTDEELEKTARAICTNLGLDPDERVSHGYLDDMTPAEKEREKDANGCMFVPDIAIYSPRWRLFRSEAAMFIAMRKIDRIWASEPTE